MTPAISALLTTHNRAHLLPQVLDGLERQTLPKSQFEIVAIDDGSHDDTPNLLAAYQDRLPLRIFRQNASGLAAAKNLGVFAATSPILVFLDDDDVLDPYALRAHLTAHERNPDLATAVLAHTKLDAKSERSPLMRHVTETGGQLFSYKSITAGKIHGYQEFWGGRSSCKREFLLAHGVFNTAFRFGCEDIELGWRLRQHGLRVIYDSSASATMIRTLSFEDFCLRSYRQGSSQYHFSQIHPDPEIRAYCEIDQAFAAFNNDWRDYAAILRRAKSLDRQASLQIATNTPLGAELQKQLDAAYLEAFALTRAKGVVDAHWLAETTQPSLHNRNYGLPGNFSELMRTIETSPQKSVPQGA